MKNMNTADRLIRTLIVVAIGVAYFTGILSGPWALGLGVVAAVLLGTSLFSTCRHHRRGPLSRPMVRRAAASMPTRQRGNASKNLSTSDLCSLRRSTVLPDASAPCA